MASLVTVHSYCIENVEDWVPEDWVKHTYFLEYPVCTYIILYLSRSTCHDLFCDGGIVEAEAPAGVALVGVELDAQHLAL